MKGFEVRYEAVFNFTLTIEAKDQADAESIADAIDLDIDEHVELLVKTDPDERYTLHEVDSKEVDLQDVKEVYDDDA